MNFYSFPPVAAVLDGAYHVISALSAALEPFGGTSSAAFAIVLLTTIVRTLLVPVGISQVRAEIIRRRLAPKLAELQRKYKKNPQLLQRKTLELYRQEKASPFGGILPTLLQAPVLSVLYGLFVLAIIAGHPNALLTEHLFGVSLGSSLLAVLGSATAWPQLLVFVGLLLAIAAVAWMSRRTALRMAPVPVVPVAGALRSAGAVLSWLPFLTVVFAALVPLAATIYLAVTTAWTLGERAILRRTMAS
ncbi:MAG: preprotein translocase YidC [Rhodoglobus sp.]|nr:preprotein translocase YidC [Rhodoglobus sp.]